MSRSLPAISFLVLFFLAGPTWATTTAYEWSDYTKPFKTRINNTSSQNPGTIQVKLPASIADKPIVLNISTSTSTASGSRVIGVRFLLFINAKYHSAWITGPGASIAVAPGIFKPGVNTLRIFGPNEPVDVYEIRLEMGEQLAVQPPSTPEAARKPSPEPAVVKAPEPRPPPAPPPPAAKKQEAPVAIVPEKPAPVQPVPIQSGIDPGQRWAVIIGVSAYEDSRIPSLRYATRDAQAFNDWLVSPGGGRYAPSKVKLLLDKDATNEKIKDALFNWLKQAIEEDVVVIYFAGHGSPESPDAPQNLYLLPYNARYDNIAVTGFPMWDIETALKRFIKARRVVIIADACHAAGVGQAFDVSVRADRGLLVNPINSSLQNLSDIGEGVCVISASRDREFSQEGREWGGGHGVFSYYLIEGLKGSADFDKSGSVSIGEVTVYVSQQVRRATRNAQNPVVAGRFDPSLVIGK